MRLDAVSPSQKPALAQVQFPTSSARPAATDDAIAIDVAERTVA